MPRIDPHQLLTCLTPLLAQNGGIKSSGEVIRLANLMEKYSKKLVSKCIYIQILKCTETELLGQFMAAGGWNLVHNWLRDGSESDNWPFVQELLEMLLLCPVDGNRLKSNHTPKIVKNLSLSCPHQHVKILSTKLVEQWLKIAHQEKQQLAASQNGLQNGHNGLANNVAPGTGLSPVSNDNKVNESLQNNINGQVSDVKSEDENTKKQSSELKYKVSNKEGGKLLLSLKRSTSPLPEEKDAKLSRTSSTDSKSKSSSDKDKKKSSSSSHKSSSSSSKSSHRDKDRGSSSSSSSHHKSSSSSSKDKHSSKSSSSKHSSSSSRDKDKDKDRDKPKKESEKSQAEKDKETLNLLAPMPSSKLQRIPKRQHSENSENKSAESNKDATETSPKAIKPSEPVEKKKPSISIEVRKGEKPKTVKTLNSQFRNHGLAEEPPKPPSRKDLKKPASTPSSLSLITPSLPSSAAIKTSTSPPPSKKINLDTENVQERVGGVKLIKPKPMLVESIGFMDALSASAVIVKKDTKKRRRLPSNSSSRKDEPESPKIEVKPLKFYKDTLEEADEEQTNGEKSPTKELETPTEEKEIKLESGNKSPVKIEAGEKSPNDTEVKTEIAEIEEQTEKRGPGIGCGPDGPPGVLVGPNMPRRKKRPIRWRAEEELTEVRYFELDETERTNVSKTFNEQKQMEHVGERSAFMLGRKMQTDDTMAEQTTWRALIFVDNVPEINYGSKSREVEIQAEREKFTLQELYFRHSMNDSCTEPDPESYEHVEPQIIPLEDVTGNPDSVNNFRDIQWPAPKGELPATFLSNAFGNVFGGIPPALGIPPIAINNPIANPLANFPLAGIPGQVIRDPLNPMMSQWVIPPAPFMQPPPMMAPQAPNFPNRPMNNNYRSNNNTSNNRPHNTNTGSNWVRGNSSRRGTCNQFQRTGFCRNKNCPYIHER